MVFGNVGGAVMRWVWADGQIEVVDGKISGTESFVGAVNDAIANGWLVTSQRFGTTMYRAGLGNYVQTVMTVDAVADSRGVVFTETPPSPPEFNDLLDA